MAVTQDYSIFLFGSKNVLLSKEPVIVNGVSMGVVYPEIVRQFEMRPLGKIMTMIAYDEVGDYQGRFTIADYLEKNIIDKQQNLD
jgi:hypothetical protein